MITRSESFKTEDGQLFATENEAKLHELRLMLTKAEVDPAAIETTIRVLSDQLNYAIEILTGSVRVRGRYNRKAKSSPATTDKTKS